MTFTVSNAAEVDRIGRAASLTPHFAYAPLMLAEGWAERNQGMITLVGIVVAALIALVIYWRQRPVKTLDYIILSDEPILSSTTPGLSVKFLDEELVAPRLVSMRIINTGNQAIRAADFNGDMQIQVENSHLVTAITLDRREGMRDLPVTVVPLPHRNCTSTEGILFNQGDWLEMQVLVDDRLATPWTPESIRFSAAIEGQSRPPRALASVDYQKVVMHAAEGVLLGFFPLNILVRPFVRARRAQAGTQ